MKIALELGENSSIMNEQNNNIMNEQNNNTVNEHGFLDNWYALFVKTGQEDKVKKRLLYRFGDELKILVPKRKLRERRFGKWHFAVRPLFPGYVLLNGNITSQNIHKFWNVPGLLKLLRTGSEPSKIERHEMEVISRLIINGEVIGISSVFVENKKVRVIDGPLVSMEGYIVSMDHRKGRAKVKLTFLGELRTVDLGISLIRPAD